MTISAVSCLTLTLCLTTSFQSSLAFIPSTSIRSPLLVTDNNIHNTNDNLILFNNAKNKGAATAAALDEVLSIYLAQYEGKKGNRGEQVVTQTFNEMCRVYGTENASTMVQIEPRVLNFDASNFSPCFDIWAEKFGRDEAMAMLLRNPNLLAIRDSGPGSAGEAGDDTMIVSYVVAATRPGGKYLLFALFALLSVPGIEAVTGLNIRGNVIPGL